MSDTWQRGCKYFWVVCELRMRETCLSSANTTQGGYTSSTEKKTIPEKCTSNNNDEKSMSDKKLSPSAPTQEKKNPCTCIYTHEINS